jgi:hypothetical protein
MCYKTKLPFQNSNISLVLQITFPATLVTKLKTAHAASVETQHPGNIPGN